MPTVDFSTILNNGALLEPQTDFEIADGEVAPMTLAGDGYKYYQDESHPDYCPTTGLKQDKQSGTLTEHPWVKWTGGSNNGNSVALSTDGSRWQNNNGDTVRLFVAGQANGDKYHVEPQKLAGSGDYALSAALTGAAVTTITFSGTLPAGQPATGKLSVKRDSGTWINLDYTAVNIGTATFTIPSTDFSADNAASGNDACSYAQYRRFNMQRTVAADGVTNQFITNISGNNGNVILPFDTIALRYNDGVATDAFGVNAKGIAIFVNGTLLGQVTAPGTQLTAGTSGFKLQRTFNPSASTPSNVAIGGYGDDLAATLPPPTILAPSTLRRWIGTREMVRA